MRIFVLSLTLLCALPVVADVVATSASAAFATGLRAYETGRYDRAITLLETAIAADPECARCMHMLGKSYGRMAEHAAWLEAIKFAKKTRLALESAIELAPEDPEVIEDLIRYYRAAPGFLGGSDEKARALEQRLLQVATDRTS